MDWKTVVGDLMQAQMTQQQIAEACGVAQSTISDLHRGATKEPSFGLGMKLQALHAARARADASPIPAPTTETPHVAG